MCFRGFLFTFIFCPAFFWFSSSFILLPVVYLLWLLFQLNNTQYAFIVYHFLFFFLTFILYFTFRFFHVPFGISCYFLVRCLLLPVILYSWTYFSYSFFAVSFLVFTATDYVYVSSLFLSFRFAFILLLFFSIISGVLFLCHQKWRKHSFLWDFSRSVKL